MIPQAKKNLHECRYHLDKLLKSSSYEEVEINFSAFVNAARNTTFVLQKEFSDNPEFVKWYGSSTTEKDTCEFCGHTKKINIDPSEGTKQHEMKNDELCKFFIDLRNKIAKEGANDLRCLSMHIESMDSEKDFPNRPPNAKFIFSLMKGPHWLIDEGGPGEDLIPATSKTAKFSLGIAVNNPPTEHLGNVIPNPDLVTIMTLYYQYLKQIVEEWTGILNRAK